VNAIIFLAPISTFDQVLAEVGPLPPKVARLGSISPKDPHVNRLEDSLLLWKSIISNKLLSDVDMILFLNKCDLLQVCSHPQTLAAIALTFCKAKLDAGVRLNQHMVSYGDRPNNYDSVSNCALTLFMVPDFALIPIQILGTNSLLFINRTPRTESGNYTVRLPSQPRTKHSFEPPG
jgi:hypothetical protein